MLFESSSDEKINPDHLAQLYIHLTDDLAYARTFYPRSQIVKYLNGLAARTHLAIYKNKRTRQNRLLNFVTTELPLVYYGARKYMLYAFLMFTFSFLIGTLSTLNEQDYVAQAVLGEAYVKMTEENIKKGDPTAVYKGDDSFSMFVRITINNITVSFRAFVFGVLFSIGTIWILFQNGIMLGAFLTMFYVKGVFWEALPIIYIHGTLEISAIVIAGAAGLMLGHSILFPKTYTRKHSILQGAKNGLKMIIGLMPVFVMAGFLESYVTRLSDMPFVINLMIILVSLAFIIWYYVLYPITIHRESSYEPQII